MITEYAKIDFPSRGDTGLQKVHMFANVAGSMARGITLKEMVRTEQATTGSMSQNFVSIDKLLHDL
jgi:hypothetical protein